MGEQLGLDYAGTEALARMMQIEITPDRLDQLQLLETTCLQAWRNDRQRQEMIRKGQQTAQHAAQRGQR